MESPPFIFTQSFNVNLNPSLIRFTEPEQNFIDRREFVEWTHYYTLHSLMTIDLLAYLIKRLQGRQDSNFTYYNSINCALTYLSTLRAINC